MGASGGGEDEDAVRTVDTLVIAWERSPTGSPNDVLAQVCVRDKSRLQAVTGWSFSVSEDEPPYPKTLEESLMALEGVLRQRDLSGGVSDRAASLLASQGLRLASPVVRIGLIERVDGRRGW